MLERILIAAHGEVASRIGRTCRRLGVETVGVHIKGDHDAPHVEACDEPVEIGDDPTAYRNTAALIAIAKEKGALGIHPGYAPLSQRAELAADVEAAGLTFIGPTAASLEASLDRIAVLAHAVEHSVRTLSTSERPIRSADEAREDAERIGYPVALLPARGTAEDRAPWPCEDAEALEAALASVDERGMQRGLILEAHVDRARVVEVVVASDGTDVAALGEYDVSLARGGRRLLSEAPAMALEQLHDGDAVRGALFEAAVSITAQIGCIGIGSCQFVLDADNAFYFVGFTPGLQVESATVEMCAGLDLVEIQLELASGAKLPTSLERAQMSGSALLARIDAATDPNTQKPFESSVTSARWPPAPPGKVRIESGVKIGSTIHGAYDPLVASVTTYAPNRHDALLMLDRILAEIHLAPLVTNLRLLRKALNHESMRAGQYDLGFLDRI
ncbi:MAG: biotin carboxylase N-terminal domain-containing protein [Sandaracinaceae bacterium]